LRVCLLARDSGDAVSGGHRYHHHLLAAAAAHGVTMWVERPGVRRSLISSADIVVLDSLDAAKAVLRVGGRRQGAPAVALVHQRPGGVDRPRWAMALRRRLDLAVYRSCALVVAVGPGLAADLVGERRVDAARVTVIEPGCDLPPGPAVAPLRRGRRLGLLHVANWFPNKDVLSLVEAVATLPADDVTLHLVGRRDVAPRYTAAIERRLARPDLAGRVVVHGPVPADGVAGLLAAADAFAFPSRVETYGTAAAEALAAGLPILGWRTPHLRHLVDDGVEGLLAAVGDVDGLAAAAHRLAADDGARRVLAAGAARRGARLPTWGETAARFFGALARLGTEAVEPAHDRPAVDHVDPAHAGVLDEQAVGDRERDPQRPRQ
jgi:glycosyltransferase involved in cell wall biosynthesis